MSLRLLFGFLLLPVIGHAETVIIGTAARFPPVVFIDGTGTLTGRDKEIGTEICDRAELTCEWVITEFEALIPGVATGRFDMAIAGIAATPERARSVDFTDPYQPPRQNLSLFVGTEGGIVPADALIAVQSGTTHEAHLQAQGLETAGYPDNVAALNAMIDGRTDLFFGTALFLHRMVDDGYDTLVANGEQTVPSWGTAIALAQGRDSLRQRLDAIIAEMREDDTLDLLHKKWTLNSSDT